MQSSANAAVGSVNSCSRTSGAPRFNAASANGSVATEPSSEPMYQLSQVSPKVAKPCQWMIAAPTVAPTSGASRAPLTSTPMKLPAPSAKCSTPPPRRTRRPPTSTSSAFAGRKLADSATGSPYVRFATKFAAIVTLSNSAQQRVGREARYAMPTALANQTVAIDPGWRDR